MASIILTTQMEYYRGLIQKNPAWEFCGIYADEGISGTSRWGRGGLLADAGGMRKGKDGPHTNKINYPVCQEYSGHLIHGPPSKGNRGLVCILRRNA